MYMMNTVSYLYGIMNIGKYAYWHPIILWILLLLYLFNPFKILNFEFRYWFLKCVLRMLASPFTAVRFSDFFIADQLTSLGDVLFELQFIACIYPATSQSNVMKLFCDSTKSIGIPILNYIPYHCRFMQCLRKYYDTRQKMHLLNALKYASSCIVVIVAFIDKLMMMTRGTHDSYWTFLRIVWLIGNMCSTCLKLYWDLKIDMGLFENGVSLLSWPWSSSSSSSFHLFLRRKLIFSPLYYYLAMIGNIILRWAWLPFVFVKAFVFIEPSTLEWILYMFITLELLRRFVWNIFRVEHENLANIENYRATKDIPLPFDTTTTSNRIEQVQSKKNFYMDLKKTSHDKASSWARKVMEMAKSMLLCFGRGDAVDDEDIWIIDEEELERLRRENAKRPNLKIQLTLPFDLETLRREFGVVPHSREQTTSDHLVTSSNQIHTDSNQSSVGVVGVAGSGASAANTTEEPLRVGKDHRPYSLTENSMITP
ncbi:hypothetical protein C9374_008914 [Naegleria lovaniensis]|uniref:EXS domain-containing protein n=1 Tax=Naegleria lovaniensis TaxID=51637 RepID=A0AA88GED8_NAELO|nr:uncharacterized protein C9374_008914 [Naegleria lovaniensis]KAG2377829.1 hypothetical protein C9374_008914 [Naegleria lovaniensis]